MKKTLLNRVYNGIVTGIFIGFMISILFSVLVGDGNYYPAPPRFMAMHSNQINSILVSIALWSVIGLIFSIGGLIFTNTDWSILKMTVVHFLTAYVCFLPIAILCGWFPLELISILLFTAIYIVIYIVIWMISSIMLRKEVEEVNEMLKKRKIK
ncbi:DUF3021 domain-containing protein [Peptostreptococcus faecalis]|uniref:DUF3021 domain-containing protein n=1 Tax=Peptostreptococcus faecalis TaxID=2045015 RepID=UPI000C7CADB4|nr:DUF3021 domain-containing protein [Peptostreptococcus faecalis]